MRLVILYEIYLSDITIKYFFPISFHKIPPSISEFLRLDLFDRDEERFGHIVVCFGGGGVLYTAQEKHIERVHFEAAERINIRQ